jgi:hypothetical protein
MMAVTPWWDTNTIQSYGDSGKKNGDAGDGHLPILAVTYRIANGTEFCE